MRHTIPTITAVGLLALSSAARAAAPDTDGPISTSSAAVDPQTVAATAAQIDDYLRATPLARDDLMAVAGPRRAHGAVSVSVGTGGYRSVAMRTDIPVGETGMVSIAVEQSRFGRRHR